MNDLLLRRRAMMSQANSDYWDYVFTAGENGFLPKTEVRVAPGDHVIIAWDTSRYNNSPSDNIQTAFGVNTANGAYASVADTGLSGNYPICCNKSYNVGIFRAGRFEFTCGNSVGYITIGYWNENIKSRNYMLYGDYVKIKIIKGESS